MSKCKHGGNWDCEWFECCGKDKCSMWNNAPIPTDHCIPGGSPGPWPFSPPGTYYASYDTQSRLWSLERQFRDLQCRVDKQLCSANGALAQLQARAVNEGAYYGKKEVSVTEGYSTDDSCPYYITRIRRKDASGCPITVELHLAYNNTTNAQVLEDVFSASNSEYADKCFSAIPVTGKGWYGHPIFKGAPIPANDEPDLYTVGFNEKGTMRVFNNGVSHDALRQSCIKNAMGCSGIIVNDKEVADEKLYANVPNKDAQTSRVCMGQNYDTGDTFFLCCSSYDAPGMRTKTCAEVLAGYGCNIAVELCEGVSCGTTDKGGLIVKPDNADVPETYAYWFISKKCQYKKQSTFEIAHLTQKVGSIEWRGILNRDAIEDLQDQINSGNDDIAELEGRVKSLEDRADTSDGLIAQLRTDLEKEIADRIAAVEDLQRQINALDPSDIRDALDKLTTRVGNSELRLDVLESWRATVDASLETLKNDVNSHYQELLTLQGTVKTLSDTVGSLQTQFETLDTAFLNVLNAFKEIQEGFTEIKTQWAQIQIDFDNLTTLVNTFEQRITNLEGLVPDVKWYDSLGAWPGGSPTSQTWSNLITLPLDSAVLAGFYGTPQNGWPDSAATIYECLSFKVNYTTTNAQFTLVGTNNGIWYRSVIGTSDTGWVDLKGGGSFDPTDILNRLDQLESRTKLNYPYTTITVNHPTYSNLSCTLKLVVNNNLLFAAAEMVANAEVEIQNSNLMFNFDITSFVTENNIGQNAPLGINNASNCYISGVITGTNANLYPYSTLARTSTNELRLTVIWGGNPNVDSPLTFSNGTIMAWNTMISVRRSV